MKNYDVIVIGAGIALLLTGRNLFWLFVGLIGFTAGIRAATTFLLRTHPRSPFSAMTNFNRRCLSLPYSISARATVAAMSER